MFGGGRRVAAAGCLHLGGIEVGCGSRRTTSGSHAPDHVLTVGAATLRARRKAPHMGRGGGHRRTGDAPRLTRAGIPSPRRRRSPLHRAQRERMPREGRLLSMSTAAITPGSSSAARASPCCSPSTRPRARSSTRSSAPPRTPADTSCSWSRSSGAVASRSRSTDWHEGWPPPHGGYSSPPGPRPHVGQDPTRTRSGSQEPER